MRAAVVCLIVMLAAAACTSDSASSTAASAAESTAAVSSTTSPSSGSSATAPSTAATTTTTTTTEPLTTTTAPPSGPPLIEGIVLPEVVLETPAAGGGDRPLLQWQAVDGAVRYEVIVFDRDDDAYWAWSTAETSVTVGGVPDPPADMPGPRIVSGMSWLVLAVGADGLPVAQSGRRPIAP